MVRVTALVLAGLGVAGLAAGLALRSVTGTGRGVRRRAEPENSITALAAFCDHGGAVAASPLPSLRRLDDLAGRAGTAARRAPAGSHLHWLDSDLAAAAQAAATGHPRGEYDDLYAAVGAVTATRLERCVTPGRRA